jgi:peptide/nickel transport system substrate-binding protein
MKKSKTAVGFLLACALIWSLTSLFGISALGPSAQAQSGGTLTIVMVSTNTIGIDPAGPTNTAGNYQFYPVFEPLFVQNPAGGLEPWLATSHKVSNGDKTLTIGLHKGITFQDGTPFNASAVVFNFERYASKTQNSECVPFFADVASEKAVGNYTVKVNFSRPDPAFLSAISAGECGLMASPAAVQKQGANFGYHPIGTGPFILKSYGLTGGTYTRYAGYWQKGSPKLNEIKFLLVGSNTAALDAVESGQAQLYINATAQDVMNARSAGLNTAEIKDETDSTDLGFNLTAAPFNNAKAREAVAHAINPTPLIKEFGLGLYKPSQSLIGPGSWAFPGQTIKGYPTYNPTEAKRLVSQLPGGHLSFSVIFPNIPPLPQLGAALVSQFSSAGIQMTLDPQQLSTFVQNIHQHTYAGWLSPLASPVPPNDPDLIVYRYLYSKSNLNIDGVNSPKLDQLILKSEGTFNTEARKATYDSINQQIDKLLPWAYVFNQTYWDVESKSLKGFSPSLAFPNFWQTSVS